MLYLSMFCFFKQKTAYEVRISDWSSDVCSSDLEAVGHAHQPQSLARGRGEVGLAEPPDAQIFGLRAAPFGQEQVRDRRAGADHVPGRSRIDAAHEPARTRQIGRASCRERVCQYV